MCLAQGQHILNMLYDIIFPEPSMLFCVICDWCVMVWQWYHINPNPKSLKIKIKEKEITNKKRKTKIVRVHYLELWQKCSIENRMEERI